MPVSKWITAPLAAAIVVVVVAWAVHSLVDDGAVDPAPSSRTAQPLGDAALPPAEPPAAAERSAAVSEADGLLLRGRVVDAWGEPLALALVGDASSAQPTVTASDGRFELVAALATSLQLLVLAPGHAPSLPVLAIGDGVREHDAGDLQLQRGGGWRGRVTDASGRGVAGALLTVRVLAGGPWPASLDRERLHAPVTSDANGGYAFAQLAAGNCRVLAAAAGKQAATSPTLLVQDGAVTQAEPIVLADGHELAGLVLAAGDRPVAAASVRVRARGPQARFDGAVETGADGRFRIGALPPGPLQVEVTCAGFLRAERTAVDAARGEEVVVRLEPGLALTGSVVDAVSGAAVERFAASVRRIGELDPAIDGSPTQQLERQIAALRASEATGSDDTARADATRLRGELEARLERLRQLDVQRPVVVPAHAGEVAAHAAGAFRIDGLEEGLYAVGIASPEHRFTEQGPIVVRRGVPAPDLRFAVAAGANVSGIVVTAVGGAPVANANVELLRLDDTAPAPDGTQRSLYPWVFAPRARPGIVVMAASTGGDGTFVFRQVAPGRHAVLVRHDAFADHDGDELTVTDGRRELRIELGKCASLSGRVRNVPVAMQVSVLLLGGHGTMKTVRAGAGGVYRCDGLQPGSYLVRAFPADASRYVDRLFGDLFPLHAGGVDAAKVPERDVTLAAGEVRVLDLVLDVPATGAVQGQALVNGQPARGASALLRPVPGEAPGSGGLSLRGAANDAGTFAIADVPAGKYTFVLQGPSRQELYQRALTIEAGATVQVQVDVAVGGVRGRVTVADATPLAELRGHLWVLPGALEAPGDPYEYRREHRTHRVSVTNGAFDDAALTPGAAVVIVDLRGRQRTVHRVVVPKGDVLTAEFAAGERLP